MGRGGGGGEGLQERDGAVHVTGLLMQGRGRTGREETGLRGDLYTIK